MNKAIAVIAGIIGILAIIPVDFLSWWKMDVDPTTGDPYSIVINAWAQITTDGTVESLNNLYLGAGITAVIGVILLFFAGFKESKGAAFLGSILMIAGPILFLIAQNGNTDLADQYHWMGGQMFFGQVNDYVIIPLVYLVDASWYLNLGFFLPLISGVIGFLSIKNNK